MKENKLITYKLNYSFKTAFKKQLEWVEERILDSNNPKYNLFEGQIVNILRKNDITGLYYKELAICLENSFFDKDDIVICPLRFIDKDILVDDNLLIIDYLPSISLNKKIGADILKINVATKKYVEIFLNNLNKGVILNKFIVNRILFIYRGLLSKNKDQDEGLVSQVYC